MIRVLLEQEHQRKLAIVRDTFRFNLVHKLIGDLLIEMFLEGLTAVKLVHIDALDEIGAELAQYLLLWIELGRVLGHIFEERVRKQLLDCRSSFLIDLQALSDQRGSLRRQIMNTFSLETSLCAQAKDQVVRTASKR